MRRGWGGRLPLCCRTGCWALCLSSSSPSSTPALPWPRILHHFCPAPAARSVLKFVLDERLERLGLVCLSPAGGQVVYANAALERALGYEPGECACPGRGKPGRAADE